MLPTGLLSPEDYEQRPNIAVVKIERDHRPVDDKGTYEEVHWIEYAAKGGNGDTTRDKVARLKKDRMLWPVIEPIYQAWLKGQEEPEDGTPLSVWPAVTKGQVEQLRFMHIRTVEDVANMNDAAMQRYGMGARSLRDKAQAFVTAKQGEASIAEALSKRDEQIADLQLRLQEAQEAIESLSKGRKRGRPPKDAANKVELSE